MKYERPNMELVVLETVEIITISGEDEAKDDAGTPKVTVPDTW